MSDMASPAQRLVLPVYKRLLASYPAAFRQRFEAEMLTSFQDCLNEEPTPLSNMQQVRLTFRLIADLLPAIIHEHVSEWRKPMNVSSIFQKIAVAALAAWAVIWAWFIGRWFLLLPMTPQWLLGKNYSSTINSIIGGAMFLIPFLALMAFVIPALKVHTTTENGDSVLMLRLQKMGKAQALVAWVCLGATVILWGMVFTARMGWW